MTNDYVTDINVGKIESDDLISRQAAIDAIYGCYIGGKGAIKNAPINDLYADGLEEAVDAVWDMPSVTPKAKIGHWITEARTYYEELIKRGLGVDEYTPYFVDDIACSECLAKYSVIDNETQFFKHCPNCGARMIESEEEE